MHVLAFNRSRCEEGEQIGRYVDLDTLLKESDVISLHCPLTEQTQNIISRSALETMKDGAILLNTARGPLIDEQAVADALRSGKLRGFGGDVVCSEPMADNNPLLGVPNCIVTPHMAWAPIESRQRIMDCTQRSIAAFLAGSPINTVNM
jgi:glycerate dehydrogenase